MHLTTSLAHGGGGLALGARPGPFVGALVGVAMGEGLRVAVRVGGGPGPCCLRGPELGESLSSRVRGLGLLVPPGERPGTGVGGDRKSVV